MQLLARKIRIFIRVKMHRLPIRSLNMYFYFILIGKEAILNNLQQCKLLARCKIT